MGIAIDKGTGIFNGDMGVIQEIDLQAEQVEVLFDDYRTVTYSFESLDELELAYAVTIHKSQGSEYPGSGDSAAHRSTDAHEPKSSLYGSYESQILCDTGGK